MRKLFKNIFIFLYIISLIIVTSACNSADVTESVKNNASSAPVITQESTEIPTIAPTASPKPTPTIEPYTQIIIGSTGDIMCHKMQLMDAQHAADNNYNFTTNGDETYSFDHWFEYIKPSLEYADLMIGNLETTITYDNSKVMGYPLFATPKEILPALKNAGFDVLLSGNNHILDKGSQGLISTVNALEEENIYHTGAWTSLESMNTPLVIDVKGIKVGIVSVTGSVNELDRFLTEEEKTYMYLMANDFEGISQQIANCKNAGAEVIVMCPHWGYENATRHNAIQAGLAEEYIKLGADLILAHHPHVLQTVDKVEVTLDNGEKREGVVFYSLGNFVSNQMGDIERMGSVIAYVTLTRDNSSGDIAIEASNYLPIWTYVAYNSKNGAKSYYILPVGEVLDSPDTIIPLGSPSINSPLEKVWNMATQRLKEDLTQPLRSVPED